MFHIFSSSNSLNETASDQKQKMTVIKPKTSSLVNLNHNNDKLKLTKSSIKQVSILQHNTGANVNDKKLVNRSESSLAHPSTSTGSSTAIAAVEKCVKSNEIKFNEAPTTSSPSTTTTATTTGFNTLKTDLPGRVSFSKNDVYEIDYSDIDNDTDTSRSLDLNESFRKKNVHFEDEYFNKFENANNNNSNAIDAERIYNSITANEMTDSDTKSYSTFKGGNLRCKTDLPVLPEVSENGSTTVSANDSPEKIIEEYKREIENINRQHELETFKWNGCKKELTDKLAEYESHPIDENKKHSDEMNEWNSGSGDSWSSPNHGLPSNLKTKSITTISNTSDDSPTRDSTSTVINNYLKITNQKSSNPIKPSSATIKLKTTKKLTPTTTTAAAAASSVKSRKIKSAQVNCTTTATATTADTKHRMIKAKSVGQLQRLTDIKLNEFQIDKVESWMSTHEDAFSDAGLNSYRKSGKFGSSSNLEYKKAWRETPTSKTDDEGNYSLDDQIDNTSMDGSGCGEIELVLNKLEGRRMKICFGKECLLRRVKRKWNLIFFY